MIARIPEPSGPTATTAPAPLLKSMAATKTRPSRWTATPLGPNWSGLTTVESRLSGVSRSTRLPLTSQKSRLPSRSKAEPSSTSPASDTLNQGSATTACNSRSEGGIGTGPRVVAERGDSPAALLRVSDRGDAGAGERREQAPGRHHGTVIPPSTVTAWPTT